MTQEKCCGNCVFFRDEDVNGYGNCINDEILEMQHCDDEECDEYEFKNEEDEND